MIHTPVAIFGAVFELIVCLTAMIFGAWRERAGGALYLAVVAASFALKAWFPDIPAWRYLLMDGLCLLGFFALSWKSPHPWPLWACAFQLLGVMTSIATLIQVRVLAWTYYTVLSLSGYGVLISLLVGTLAAAGARRAMRNKSHK